MTTMASAPELGPDDIRALSECADRLHLLAGQASAIAAAETPAGLAEQVFTLAEGLKAEVGALAQALGNRSCWPFESGDAEAAGSDLAGSLDRSNENAGSDLEGLAREVADMRATVEKVQLFVQAVWAGAGPIADPVEPFENLRGQE